MLVFKKFNELTNYELYSILKLRNQVFIVEQQCYYQDLDEEDYACIHVLMIEDEKLVGYVRIINNDDHTSIGRIVTPLEVRKKGYGRQLVQTGIDYCKKYYPDLPIEIHAQARLKKFYQSFGFYEISDEYMWDGLAHINMQLDHNSNMR